MAINPDFHAGRACPSDRFLEIGVGAGKVRRVGIIVGPVADGDAEGVDACRSECLDIGFGEESIPVFLKCCFGVGDRVEGILIIGIGEGAGEGVRVHPFFEDKPATKINAS